jgi:hypothetical protein
MRAGGVADVDSVGVTNHLGDHGPGHPLLR